MPKYRCIDNTGYEGRLTVGRVYDPFRQFLSGSEFIHVVSDGGKHLADVMEVYAERFEKAEAAVTQTFDSVTKSWRDYQVVTGRQRYEGTDSNEALNEYERIKNKLAELKELEALVLAGKVALEDVHEVVNGDIHLEEALKRAAHLNLEPISVPEPRSRDNIVPEEGLRCSDCGGVWEYPPVENCTCHTGNPPCGQCTSNELYCSGCGKVEEDCYA